ncbi:MAG: VWA domain-containing protein [Phycisphaerae bacterium]|nr:VWA domain-containing protein [Gemmatimonadaceae bacterium]
MPETASRQLAPLTSHAAHDDEPTSDLVVAALLLAVAPDQLKGAVLYCESRALGELWIELYQSLLPPLAPGKRIPGNISDERLLGGLDFAATLTRGHAVSDRGLLAEANSGFAVLSGATTRLATYAHVARALDHQGVQLEREGLSETHLTRFAAIVVQTIDDDAVPATITDRLAFHIPMAPGSHREMLAHVTAAQVAEARELVSQVHVSERALVAMTGAAERLGIVTPRPVLLALAASRAHAALHQRTTLEVEDIACGARLVLAPRGRPATDDSPPAPADEPGQTETSAPAQSDANSQSQTPPVDERNDLSGETRETEQELTEILVQSASSALPAGLLTAFAARSMATRGTNGRAGDNVLRGVRGRQVGVRRGDPRGGARLDLVATLRAAIPMQRIRRNARTTGAARPVELRREDFRIRQCVTPATTTALFVVDASGSSAMQRLAEAKGAVELMLAEGYARRDRVALITFRGTSAQLVLPATHALARARRAISGLPAGGGTPLATALDLAASVLLQLKRSGGQFVTIILTDGRANVGRDGRGGRPRAMEEALGAASVLASVCNNVLWVDTSARSEAPSRDIAQRAGARYLLLPAPNARGLTQAVRGARGAAGTA